jgi:predicted nucleic acid-binding protein
MEREGVFIDTWGWMALGHRQERRHDDVTRYHRSLRARSVPVYTSDYVLDDVVTLLFRREVFGQAVRFVEAILAAGALGQVYIERATPDRFSAAWALRKRYEDKPMISFTDLVSMVIMDERGIRHMLTEDEHFTHTGMGFVRVP